MGWAAETIFTSRRERDLNNNLTLPEPQATAVAPSQDSLIITDSVHPSFDEPLATQIGRSLTPPGSPPSRRRHRSPLISPSISPPSPKAQQTVFLRQRPPLSEHIPVPSSPPVPLASKSRQTSRSDSVQSNLYSIRSPAESPISDIDPASAIRPSSAELFNNVAIPVEASPPPEVLPPPPLLRLPPPPKPPVHVRKKSSGLFSKNTSVEGSRAVTIKTITRVVKAGNGEKRKNTSTVVGSKSQSTRTKSLKSLLTHTPPGETMSVLKRPITKSSPQNLDPSKSTFASANFSDDLPAVDPGKPTSGRAKKEAPWTSWLKGLGDAMRAETARAINSTGDGSK